MTEHYGYDPEPIQRVGVVSWLGSTQFTYVDQEGGGNTHFCFFTGDWKHAKEET